MAYSDWIDPSRVCPTTLERKILRERGAELDERRALQACYAEAVADAATVEFKVKRFAPGVAAGLNRGKRGGALKMGASFGVAHGGTPRAVTINARRR
jgi:hypothetical protein